MTPPGSKNIISNESYRLVSSLSEVSHFRTKFFLYGDKKSLELRIAEALEAIYQESSGPQESHYKKDDFLLLFVHTKTKKIELK